MPVDLSARIGNLVFDPAIVNAAGIFSYSHVLKRIYEAGFGGVFTKTTTLEPRKGNMEPVFAHVTEETDINSFGLPNPGYEKMRDDLKEVYPLPVPLIASIFGETKEKLVKVAAGLEKYCDSLEINFSCPNPMEGERPGLWIGRDPELVESYTKAVKESVKKPVITKLSYAVYDIVEIAMAAERGGADAISAINTIPDGMKIDIYAKRPVLSTKFGGVSGRGIKPLAIGVVYKIYENVNIPIIGIGGMTIGDRERIGVKDAVEMYMAGASVIGFGSTFKGKSTRNLSLSLPSFRNDLIDLLRDEMINVSSISELVGIAHKKKR